MVGRKAAERRKSVHRGFWFVGTALGSRGELFRRFASLAGGKRLRGTIYFHVDAIGAQDSQLAEWLLHAGRVADPSFEFNLIKADAESARITLLYYPEFRTTAHPSLALALTIDLSLGQARKRDFTHSANRPILHRKELFLLPTDPDFIRFSNLTVAEETAGLLSARNLIGFEQGWARVLREHRFALEDHSLVDAR